MMGDGARVRILRASHSFASGPSSGIRRSLIRSLSVADLPSGQRPTTTAPFAPHLAQYVTDRHAFAVAGTKRRDGIGPFAAALGTAAIDDKREARQLRQRGDKDRVTLATGGGVGILTTHSWRHR
jgi:hypothetical protein